MADPHQPDPGRPNLEVAIDGHGVTPSEVPVQELIELLAAVSQLLNAVGDSPQPVCLSAVREGSAAYDLHATDPGRDQAFARAVESAYIAVETRGQGATPDVRRALLRLHRAGAQRGAVRMRGRTITADLPAIIAAAPLEVIRETIGVGTILHGTIVGVDALRSRYVVRLKPVDGPKVELEAEGALAERAGRLFNRTVRIVARHVWSPATDQCAEWEVVEVSEWHREPLLDVIAEVRREGIAFDRVAFLESLRDGDDL